MNFQIYFLKNNCNFYKLFLKKENLETIKNWN